MQEKENDNKKIVKAKTGKGKYVLKGIEKCGKFVGKVVANVVAKRAIESVVLGIGASISPIPLFTGAVLTAKGIKEVAENIVAPKTGVLSFVKDSINNCQETAKKLVANKDINLVKEAGELAKGDER